MAAVSVFLVLVSLVAALGALRVLGPDPLQASFVATVLLATDFAIRPLELVLGLDKPFPDEAFAARSVNDAIIKAQLAYLLWVLLFTLSVILTRGVKPRRKPSRNWFPTDEGVRRLLPLLAVVAVGASAVVWQRYGLSSLGRVAKSRDVDIPNFLRAPAVLLAYLGVATAVVGHRDRSTKTLWWGLLAFLLGAAVSFSWGARSTALLPLAIVVGWAWIRRQRVRSLKALFRQVGVAALVVLAVAGAGLGLRALREVIAYGETNDRTTQGSLVRRLAVTTNHTRYDANLLLFDDGQPQVEQPGLGVFVDAVERSFWPVGTERSGLLIPALEVRQTFEPAARNGWPLTALGDWFFAAGWAGLFVGATLSGVLFGAIDRWRNANRQNAWVAATALTTLFATTVTWGGFGVTTPARARSLLVIGVLLLLAWSVADRMFSRWLSLRAGGKAQFACESQSSKA